MNNSTPFDEDNNLIFEITPESNGAEMGFSTQAQKDQFLGSASLQEKEQVVALSEPIFNKKGEVYDVVFINTEGKSRTLKSVLPGNYTINYYTKEEAEETGKTDSYSPVPNTINVVENSDGELNLTLLHEAGHAVDAQTNKHNYALTHTYSDGVCFSSSKATWCYLETA